MAIYETAVMTTLENARLALAAGVSGLAVIDTPDGPDVSCKLELEDNISPDSYPLIRVVLTRLTPRKQYAHRGIEAMIVFGAKIANSEGMAAVLDGVLTMEDAIDAVRKAQGWVYVDTIANPAPFEAPKAYKLMGMRVEMRSAPLHASGGGLAAQASTVAGEAVETPV